MPTTALTPVDSPNRYAGNSAILTMAAGDVANGNHFAAGDDSGVFVHNTNAGAQTLTIISQPDPISGRLATITALSLAADQYRFFRLAKSGWADVDSEILISASHADVKIGIINLATEVLT
jgi:hypothetical protein